MAQVAALRETGVILAAAIGAFFLNEPFGPRRIVAAAIVVAGIAILETSR
jgi:drug/metabolite transporter (DMT)-like permease